MGVWYCTREDVKSALDIKATARSDAQVDQAIESASRAIEGQMHRKFYPLTTTKYFDWPNYQYTNSWRLWLDDDVVSVSALSSGGTTIGSSDYFLEPANGGPPYTSLQIDLASSASFGSGDTHQRSVAITGVFGYSAETTPAGVLENAIASTSTTTVDVTDSFLVGVGDIIKVDDERMIVTGKTFVDTTLNVATGLSTGVNSDVSVTTSSNTNIIVGETILVDNERLLVVDKFGATGFTVKRAWDGSVLATHGTPDIYAPRRLTVERGALGTTAATHLDAAAVTKHVVPGTIRALCKAEAINTIQQDQSAWGRVVGQGDNEREMAGRGLQSLWDQAYVRYGRKLRIGAI